MGRTACRRLVAAAHGLDSSATLCWKTRVARTPVEVQPTSGSSALTVEQYKRRIGLTTRNLGNGPAGTPACPGTTSGTVTGMATAASVVAVATQNVPAGNFAAVINALVTNTAYANVHTHNFPGGEIRGQIQLVEDQQGHNPIVRSGLVGAPS
jgi:hypothetical protein